MPRTSAKPLRDAQRRLIELAGVRVFSLRPEPPFSILGLPLAEQSDLSPGVAPAPSLTDLVAPEDMAVAAACLAQALAHPGTLCETELRLAEDPSSPSAWARFHALSAEYEGGPVVHGSLLPIGGQKRAEALAEQRQAEFEREVLKRNETQRFLEGLQHTTELLQMAEREADGYRVVEQAGRALMPNWQGAVTTAGRDGEMSLVASWGGEPGQKAALVQGQEADCWALRLGRLHHVGDHATRRDAGPVCAHFGFGESLPPTISNAICVPFHVAPGQPGALHLLATDPIGEEELQASIWRAQSFADTLRPSLANLHLRATLREQAERDGMTNLFNRRYFDDALAREISRAERGRDRLTLAIFDIDYFKSFNDAYGHEAGDEVIRTVARQLLHFVRSYDVACRIGGEELALLMPDAPLAHAAVRLDQLREQIARQRTQHQGVELPAITVSVGVAGLESGDAGDLLRRADLALYASKNAGRNRLTCWTPDLDTTMPTRGTAGEPEGSQTSGVAGELPAPDCCPPGTPSSGPEARLTEPVRAWAGDLV